MNELKTNMLYGSRLPFIITHINLLSSVLYDQVLPFWNTSRMQITKNNTIPKSSDLFGEQVTLLNNKKGYNPADQMNQKINILKN